MGLQRVKCDWVTFTFTNSSQKPLDCLSYCLLWLPLDASSHILSYTVLIIWSYKTTYLAHHFKSPQFSSVQLCPTIFDPMDCSMPGFSVHHQLLELAQTHVHRVGDAIQPSHPLLSPSLPTFNLCQHQGLFKWVSSSHQVAKVLELQLQHQPFQWIFRTDFL